MSIPVTCPSCHKAMKAPDNAAGRKVKCPACGITIGIPVPQVAATPFEDLHESAPATPVPRAKTRSRTVLFAAAGGVLVFLLLAVVLILVLATRGSKSSVEVSVNWKTANGIEFDDNPVAVLIPKGMTEKIDVIAPVYAGEDYEKVEGHWFRKRGAYLAVGVGGKAWFENVAPGKYTLIVFPNSFTETMDEGIDEGEARRAEKQLQPFFTRVRLDFLCKKPVHIREVEVRDRVVDIRHEFLRRGNQGQAQKFPKAEGAPKKADLNVTADELLTAIAANQLDADRRYKGKILAVTGLVEKADTALLPELDPQYFVWLRGNDKAAGSIRCGFSKFFDGFSPLRESSNDPSRKDGASILVTVVGKLEWRQNEPRLASCSMVTTEGEIITRLKAKTAAEKDAGNQAERAAEAEVKKANAVKVRPSDLAATNAKQRFAGKVVEITGVVKAVRKGRFSDKSEERLIIDLELDKKPESDRFPTACSFSLGHSDLLAKVRPGQTVSIRGRCDESLPDFLWHCSIVDASQAKEAEQSKEPLGKQQRAKLLAELDAKKQDALPALQDQCRRHEADLEKLRKEEADLRKNPRFGDPFNKQITSQFNALLKKQRALATTIQKARDNLDQKTSDFEQEKRRILTMFPEPGDPKLVEYKELLHTQEELDRLRAYEREHSDPRTVADSYMKLLAAKKLVSLPKLAGFYKNPKGEDSFAAAYKVSSVNGKTVLGDTVHLFVFKDKKGFWQISAFSQDGVHVMLGPPPREYQQVPVPNEKK